MKTIIKSTVMLVWTALVLAVAVQDVRANNKADHCGIGEVTSFSQVGIQGFRLYLSGTSPVGLAGSTANCQARLYDDNGPDVPHVWCEDDMFLLGILMFEPYKELGLPRETSSGFLQQFDNRVMWHSASGTVELDLTRTVVKDAVSFLGHLVYFHEFNIMGGDPLQPGDYGWVWTVSHPLAVTPDNPDGVLDVIPGDVEIVSHDEHLARDDAGTW